MTDLREVTKTLHDSTATIDKEVPATSLLKFASAAASTYKPPHPPLTSKRRGQGCNTSLVAASENSSSPLGRDPEEASEFGFETRRESCDRWLRQLWDAYANALSAWAITVAALQSAPLPPFAQWLGNLQRELDSHHMVRLVSRRVFSFDARIKPIPAVQKVASRHGAADFLPADSTSANVEIPQKMKKHPWQTTAWTMYDRCDPTLIEDVYQRHGQSAATSTAHATVNDAASSVVNGVDNHDEEHARGGRIVDEALLRRTRVFGGSASWKAMSMSQSMSQSDTTRTSGEGAGSKATSYESLVAGDSRYSNRDSLAESATIIKRVPSSTTLVVLVHGYGGSANDMRLICSFLQLEMPTATFLISQSNQRSSASIQAMGEQLATEINSFVQCHNLELRRISFVTFSLGGCIANAALRHPSMSKFAEQLHTLCTISSPLLGLVAPGESFAVSSGVWLLANVAGDQAMKQLLLADGERSENGGILIQLTQRGSFPQFRHMVLVGSTQDKCAVSLPFYVARAPCALHMPAPSRPSQHSGAP